MGIVLHLARCRGNALGPARARHRPCRPQDPASSRPLTRPGKRSRPCSPSVNTENLPAACPTACRGRASSRRASSFRRTPSFSARSRSAGPDLASSLDSELIAASARLNNALRRLGSGWGLFVEAQRFLSSAYPRGQLAAPGRGGGRSRTPARVRAGRGPLRVELLPDLHLGAAARPRGRARRTSSTRTAAARGTAQDDERRSLERDLHHFEKTVAEVTDILRSVLPEVGAAR